MTTTATPRLRADSFGIARVERDARAFKASWRKRGQDAPLPDAAKGVFIARLDALLVGEPADLCDAARARLAAILADDVVPVAVV